MSSYRTHKVICGTRQQVNNGVTAAGDVALFFFFPPLLMSHERGTHFESALSVGHQTRLSAFSDVSTVRCMFFFFFPPLRLSSDTLMCKSSVERLFASTRRVSVNAEEIADGFNPQR